MPTYPPGKGGFFMEIKPLRGGYTTGSCAAAGMKAALTLLCHKKVLQEVTVTSPQGQEIQIPIAKVTHLDDDAVEAIVVKDAGDDPDVTHGTDVIATVRLITNGKGLIFKAGQGVGTVTKKGLALPPGEPAINPGPRNMMQKVYDTFYSNEEGVEVTISVPAGEALAKKTLNATLGIVGGISIIGTTGIVKPMSEEGFKNSLVPQLAVMKAAHCTTAVLVPGRIGHELAEKVLHIPANQLAETSNFIGFMLEESVKAGFAKILIIGHLGKIIKLASGSFHTHNRMSDGRMETLAAYAALYGASREVVESILNSTTTEAAMPIIEENGLQAIYQYAAERAVIRSERYIAKEATVGVILSTLDGSILAVSESAKQIGATEQWDIPSL